MRQEPWPLVEGCSSPPIGLSEGGWKNKCTDLTLSVCPSPARGSIGCPMRKPEGKEPTEHKGQGGEGRRVNVKVEMEHCHWQIVKE